MDDDKQDVKLKNSFVEQVNVFLKGYYEISWQEAPSILKKF